MTKNFISLFSGVEDHVGNIVKKIKNKSDKIIVFGAGYCLSMVFELCQIMDVSICAIVDNNEQKWNKKIRGVAVISLKDVIARGYDLPILISTSHTEEILRQIKESGYRGEVFYLPKPAYYKNTIYGLEYIERNEERFSQAYEALEDDISREVFLGVLKHNISLDNKFYDDIEKHEIDGYFGTSLYQNRTSEVLVDVGAFNGDTIAEFMRSGRFGYKKIYAFEPDVNNFNLLKQSVTEKSDIVVINAGLGEQCAKLRFVMGGGVSSRVDEEGEDYINIETIDHFFDGEYPTFIKMDIEGAERAALLGGRNVIGNCTPTLAISAYHKAEDLFDLIELIREINKGYKIYLRHTFYYQTVRYQPDVIIYALNEGAGYEVK